MRVRMIIEEGSAGGPLMDVSHKQEIRLYGSHLPEIRSSSLHKSIKPLHKHC